MADVNPMPGNCKYSKIISTEIRKHFGELERLIELGCGCGGNLAEFPNAEVLVGIDPLEYNVKAATAILHNYNYPRHHIVLGDHTFLKKFGDNNFDVGFTCSVLDHIENFGLALRELCRVSKKVMLFEPYIEGVERRALEVETSCWETTWYHNYHFALTSMGVEFERVPFPLYPTDSGPLFHQFVIDSEQYDARFETG